MCELACAYFLNEEAVACALQTVQGSPSRGELDTMTS